MEDEKPIEAEEVIDLSRYTLDVTTEAFSVEAQRLYDHLTSRVIGQDRAARKVARAFAVHNAGLGHPNKPIAALIFSGPTGWGKTEMANQVGRFFVTDSVQPPVTNIKCSTFKEPHEISKLIGASPNYVGYGDPYQLMQYKIDEWHFFAKCREQILVHTEKETSPKGKLMALQELYEANKPYYSTVVFNEYEKAVEAVHEVMLHIVDEAEITGGDGRVTRFDHSIVILTTNIGGRAQQDLMSGRDSRIGIRSDRRKSAEQLSEEEQDTLDAEIYEITKQQIAEKFSPEHVGRFSEGLVVFRTLDQVHQMQILRNMLTKLSRRFTVEGNLEDGGERPIFTLRFSNEFRVHLLKEGVNMRHGIRKLEAAFQRFADTPLANAILSGMVGSGDDVVLHIVDGKVRVLKKAPPEGEPLLILPPPKDIG